MRDLLWLWIVISNHRGVDTKVSYHCCNFHWVEAAFRGFGGNFRIFPSLFLFFLLEARHLKVRKLNTIVFSRELRRSPGSVQSLSRVRPFATPWTAAHQASLSFTICWSLLKLVSIELIIASNHLILCGPLLLLPSIFPSIRVFSNESVLCIKWPKYWSFSFSSRRSPSMHIKRFRFMEKEMGNPLQYSCLEKSVDRGAWWAEVHRITWLSMCARGWREMGW